VPVGLGAFCALGAQRQHKMCQRKYQVEAVVRFFFIDKDTRNGIASSNMDKSH